MKRYTLLILLSIFVVFPSQTKAFGFGDSLTVSLITCEPGEVLYAKFGHTAIRIQDETGLDLAFNYGVFDFQTKHFYWKFIRGHTDYVLAVYPFSYFLADYQMRNSSVWEQVLTLDEDEKRDLLELLRINYQPENRMYRYNFVYDNCSTRPYDVLNMAAHRAILVDKPTEKLTAREMINDCVADAPWAMVGINLVFGTDADKPLPMNIQTFLPEHLMEITQATYLVDVENNQYKTPLVSELNKLVDAYPEEKESLHWTCHPTTLSFILLIIGFMLVIFFRDMNHITHKVFDSTLFLIMGIGGSIMFFLMFFSEHPLTGKNLNLLWMNPLNLVLAVCVWLKRTDKCLFFYNIFYLSAIMISYVLLFFVTHSGILEMIPFMALVLMRVLWREERLFHLLLEPGKRGLQWKK